MRATTYLGMTSILALMSGAVDVEKNDLWKTLETESTSISRDIVKNSSITNHCEKDLECYDIGDNTFVQFDRESDICFVYDSDSFIESVMYMGRQENCSEWMKNPTYQLFDKEQPLAKLAQ